MYRSPRTRRRHRPCCRTKRVSPRHASSILISVLVSAGVHSARSQQAVSPIEPGRLGQSPSALASHRADANGTLLADDDATSDDGFGEQVILKTESRPPTFVVTGSTSVSYTNNAALTPNNRIDDTFFNTNAAISWTPVLTPRLTGDITASGSIFRYDRTPALDFQTFGLGTGIFWNPQNFANISLFARYDFIEMFDRHSDEILRDNEFTLGAQRGFALGHAQTLVVGVGLMAGLADPESAQRDQAGLFLDYRLQMTRSLGFGVLYRFGGFFYNDTGRIDRTQLLSTSLYYQVWRSVYINAFFSYAGNRSDDSLFNYDAVTNGGGLSATIQF